MSLIRTLARTMKRLYDHCEALECKRQKRTVELRTLGCWLTPFENSKGCFYTVSIERPADRNIESTNANGRIIELVPLSKALIHGLWTRHIKVFVDLDLRDTLVLPICNDRNQQRIFDSCNFDDYNFSALDVSNCTFQGCTMSNTIFPMRHSMQACHFYDCILDGAKFSDKSHLANVKFSNCRFVGALFPFGEHHVKNSKFIRCDMRGMTLMPRMHSNTFERCNFAGCVFVGEHFGHSAIFNCNFTGAKIMGCKLSTLIDTDEFPASVMDGVDFTYSDLSGTDILNIAPNCDFYCANLSNTDFSCSDISNSDFTGANLLHANIGQWTKMHNTKMRDAVWCSPVAGLLEYEGYKNEDSGDERQEHYDVDMFNSDDEVFDSDDEVSDGYTDVSGDDIDSDDDTPNSDDEATGVTSHDDDFV